MELPASPSARFRERLVIALGYGLFLFTAAFSVRIALYHLNFQQSDFLGHLFSGELAARGAFGRFNDQMFLGYTHALFYPPLEDWLLALPLQLGADPVHLMKWYVAGLAVYLMSCGAVYFSGLKTNRARVVFSGGFSLFFFIRKADMLDLQGLSLVDLVVTGLTSEFVAFGFLLLYVRLLKDERPSPIRAVISTLLLAATLLTHIVVGLAAFFFTSVLFLSSGQRRRLILRILVTAALISAFSWLPVALHRDFVSSSHLFRGTQWGLAALTVLALGLTQREQEVERALLLCGLVFFVLNSGASLAPEFSRLLPAFHYYRFPIIGLLFLLIATASLIDAHPFAAPGTASPSWRTMATLGVALGQIAVVTAQQGFQDFDTRWVSFTPASFDFSRAGDLKLDGYGRYLVVGTVRTADTGLDSLLSILQPEFRSTKGLFWESSRSNNLESSFLATLFSSPVVLDHFHYDETDCRIWSCLFEQHLRYFGVKGLITPVDPLPYVRPEKQACLQSLLRSGTEHFAVQLSGRIGSTEGWLGVFKLVPKVGVAPELHFSAAPAEPVMADGIESIESARPSPYAHILETAYAACEAGRLGPTHVLLSSDDLRRYGPAADSDAPAEVPLSKVGATQFKVETPADRDRLYLLKLSPQPGVTARREDGQAVPVVRSYPYLLVFGRGTIVVDFERPPGVAPGLALTVLGLLLTIVSAIRRGRTPAGNAA
ncbi:MAG: hypothetical protein U1E65_04895 [Myxococcota bacterium]